MRTLDVHRLSAALREDLSPDVYHHCHARSRVVADAMRWAALEVRARPISGRYPSAPASLRYQTGPDRTGLRLGRRADPALRWASLEVPVLRPELTSELRVPEYPAYCGPPCSGRHLPAWPQSDHRR